MKNLLLLISIVTLMGCKNQAQSNATAQNVTLNTEILSSDNMEKQNIYQFKVTDLNGQEFDFAKLKGK